MRSRPLAGLDPLSGLLLAFGIAGVAAALVAATSLLRPPPATQPPPAASLEMTPVAPAGRVATVLRVATGAGAAAATRGGDRIDVLGYLPAQATGGQNTTQMLLEDVPVLSVGRDAAGVILTLALPQESAMLLIEAQAIGAHPFVALRSANTASATAKHVPSTFTDADLALRLGGASGGSVSGSVH